MMTIAAIAVVLTVLCVPLARRFAAGVRVPRWPDFRSELGALLLADAQDLSNDVLLQGVYASVLNTDDLMQFLPFTEIVGNGLRYNREGTAATVAWRAVGATWTEDVSTITPVTVDLKIVGGDADTDNFLARSMSKVNDIRAAMIDLKAQALARAMALAAMFGTGASDQPLGVDGLIAAGPAGQTVSMGVNGATLTLAKIDELVDVIKGGDATVLLMSRRTRRTALSQFRASGASMETRADFGRRILMYNGIPFMVSDYIPDTITQGSNSDCSTMYALTFGQAAGGIEMLFNGGGQGAIIQHDEIGNLETKDAFRDRLKAYVAPILYNTLKVGRLVGIRT